MPTVEISLPKLHDGQREIKSGRRRFNCMTCGRRFGKNVLLQDLAIETALVQSLPVAWATPIYSDMVDDWRTLENILAPVIARKNMSDHRLELVGGGFIKFWSLDNYDAIRGKKYKRFIVNEAGLVTRLMDSWNFVIRPTLADMEGDAYFAGTPKGHNGFYSLYSQTGDDWARWQMSSYRNPHVKTSELDSMKASMPERAFQQEIMAQFIEDGGGIFRGVQRATIAKALDAGLPNRQYVIGADWGRSEDATVFTVLDVESGEVVHVDRMTDTDFALQRLRLKNLSDIFGNAICLVETNSIGQPQLEALQSMGVNVSGFNTTNTTKAQIIDALSLAFERNEITIPDEPVLVAELLAYQSERLSSGLVRYGAPSGMHDDCVMSLALAWWCGRGNVASWYVIG